jgi:hypothetical protein
VCHFLYTFPAFEHTWPSIAQAFICLHNKLFLAMHKAPYAPSRSALGHWQNYVSLNLLWWVQTDDSPVVQGDSCMLGGQGPQSIVAGVSQQYEDRWCCVETEHFSQLSQVFIPYHWFQLVTHLIVARNVYCHTPFLIMFKNLSLQILEKYEHHFCCWQRF